MATATFMASFNKDVIESDFLSEADAVTWLFELGGATSVSPKGYIKRNGVDISGLNYGSGINIRSMSDPSNVYAPKSFNLTNTDSVLNTSFIDYVNAATDKVLLFFTGPGLKSSPSVDTFFDSIGSINWPGKAYLDRFSAGYVGVYSTARKRIVSEVMFGTDGLDEGMAVLTQVIDIPEDFGANGFPYKAIIDETEYSATTGYNYNRWPTQAATNPIAPYKITPGATLALSCDTYQSPELVANGMWTRIDLRWFNGSTLIDANTVLEGKSVGWTKLEPVYTTVPANANAFTIVASRYPNKSVTAESKSKNLVLVEVLRDDTKSHSTAAIGINGIKAGTIIDGGTTPPNIMGLDIEGTSKTNTVRFVALREKDTGFKPEPGKE